MLKNLLLTATKEKNLKLSKLLSQEKISCIHCPLIEFLSITNLEPLEQDYDNAVFTSHFAIQEFNRLHPKYDFKYIFVLSNALKKLWLKNHLGFPEEKVIVSTDPKQESIIKDIIQHNISSKIIFPCSQLAAKTLEEYSSSQEITNVKRYEIYTMKEKPSNIPHNFDGIVFLSMSAFYQSYNKIPNNLWQKKKVIAFSKIMAKKIHQKIKVNKVFYPETSSLTVLAKYIKSLQ